MAFSFMPMTSVSGIMTEKISLAKHQQMVSGAFPAAYWVSNWCFDTLQMILAIILCMMIIFIGDDENVFSGEAALPILCTLFLYAYSIVPMTYFLTFFFSSVGFAQTVIFFFYFLTGIVLNIVNWAMLTIIESKESEYLVRYLYRMFPPFTMGENLIDISLRDVNISIFRGVEDPWDVNTRGRNMIWMLCTGTVFIILVVLMDICDILNWIFYFLQPVKLPCNETLDADVEREKLLLQSPASDDLAIKVQGLRKLYGIRGIGKPLEAVKGIYFGVKRGEVFGFLGTNGAGKTTTLSMLTGVYKPSEGTASICGFPITDQQNCRQKIGFCPQFDAIFNLLSPKEHLEVYCLLKGIRDKNTRNRMISRLITDLGLTQYADQAAEQLSGGNKRKLSCAIALVGDPEVVILDEPSSGMDPISKRFM